MYASFKIALFSALMLFSIGLLLYYYITRKYSALLLLGTVWCVSVIAGLTHSAIRNSQAPVQLSRRQIIGDYVVDRSFYPGPDAQWQYHRYSFSITWDDSLFFYIHRGDSLISTIKGKLTYSPGPPATWKVKTGHPCHILAGQPTLYRGHNRFYYVFKTRYGNMFFRKVER